MLAQGRQYAVTKTGQREQCDPHQIWHQFHHT
jgi:hypothetical protein